MLTSGRPAMSATQAAWQLPRGNVTASCNVTLVQAGARSKPCIPNVSYGCQEAGVRMWTAHGCSGQFQFCTDAGLRRAGLRDAARGPWLARCGASVRNIPLECRCDATAPVPQDLESLATEMAGEPALTVGILGGSISAGEGVIPGRSYPEVLERALNSQRPSPRGARAQSSRARDGRGPRELLP